MNGIFSRAFTQDLSNYEQGNWFLQTWGDTSHLCEVGTLDGDDP